LHASGERKTKKEGEGGKKKPDQTKKWGGTNLILIVRAPTHLSIAWTLLVATTASTEAASATVAAGALSSLSRRKRHATDGRDVDGTGLLVVLLDVELDFLALREGAEAIVLDYQGREVDVVFAVLSGVILNETEVAVVVPVGDGAAHALSRRTCPRCSDASATVRELTSTAAASAAEGVAASATVLPAGEGCATDRGDVDCSNLAVVLTHLEFDLLALSESAETVLFDLERRVVYVVLGLRCGVLLDEAEATLPTDNGACDTPRHVLSRNSVWYVPFCLKS
jgi:hypothetical protein